MAAPGVLIVDRESPAPRSAPTETGVLFALGLTDRGTTTPTLIRSIADYRRHYGPRVAYAALYDALETYFREGGAKAYVARVLGPAPITAFIDLTDGTAATLRVSAISAGEWGNGLSVAVEAGTGGGTFRLAVSDAGGLLERSPDLIDTAAAIAWAASSRYVRASELAGTGDPVVAAAAALTAGTDDRTNLSDAGWAAALDRFARDLGPGQVAAFGRTTQTGHTDLLAHASVNNRVALLDAPDSDQVATLTAAAVAQRSGTNARDGAMLAPWAIVPGLVAGTTRRVPYSAVQAGLIARSDALYSPNRPAAGDNGQAVYAIGLGAAFTDAQREDLAEAGVTVARVLHGGVRTYDDVTLVDPATAPTWKTLANVRLRMAIYAAFDVSAERFMFREIDGRGHVAAEFAGALAADLLPLYEADSLYGLTPQEAFQIETGPTVNTPETIEAGELRAVVSVRMSPSGRYVEIELVKRSIREAVA